MTEIEKAAKAIEKAKNIIITAGAGMGVDSGLPDFRGNQGFWRAYPALQGYPFEEMANPEWFVKYPERAWGFYGHRLNLYRKTIPHLGFSILRQWVTDKDYFIYTSNVDGAFQKAGFLEEKIVECHGSIHHVQLLKPQSNATIWSADDIQVEVDEEQLLAAKPLPMKNGQILRPNILMFGDWSWIDDRTEQQTVRLQTWLNSVNLDETVIIEMGAGTAIPSVRRFSERCERLGATLIRINPREAFGTEYTVSIAMGAKEALEKILEKIKEQYARNDND